MGATRDDALTPAVDALLLQAGLVARDLRAVVCGAGPGSFTSLRIAGAFAKGIAFANGAPLYAVSSLLLAAAASDEPGLYLVHADALRAERFALNVRIDEAGRVHGEGAVRRIAMESLAAESVGRRRIAVIASPESTLEYRIVEPDAARLVRCVDWEDAGPVDLNAWEPDYGRLAEAQVKWEDAHGRALPVS